MRKGIYYQVLALAGLFSTLQSCDKDRSLNGAHESKEYRVSYNFDIRPILSDKRFICHGPDANQRKAGLRLDM